MPEYNAPKSRPFRGDGRPVFRPNPIALGVMATLSLVILIGMASCVMQ